MFNIENRRYTGNKQKLMYEISKIINQECKGDVLCDIFAGTGSVANFLKNDFKKIIINDFLFSNNVIFEGFWGNEIYDIEKIEAYADKYNSVSSLKLQNNYFSDNYGGKYFEINDSKKIGWIRDDIENSFKTNEINNRERHILIASLIYSIDRISNTVGHYEAFLKKTTGNLKERMVFKLIKPDDDMAKKTTIFREDSSDLIKKIKCDILFLDPPYNSRQYSRFYHLLETLTKWDNPKLFGEALKPAPENMSLFSRSCALMSFKDLVKNANTSYIVVTYNNTFEPKSSSSKNKISFDDLKKTLQERGKTKVFEIPHKHFSSGKTNFNNHIEYVFVTEVENAQ